MIKYPPLFFLSLLTACQSASVTPTKQEPALDNGIASPRTLDRAIVSGATKAEPIKTLFMPICGKIYAQGRVLTASDGGSAVVKFCTDANGQIDRPVEVQQTSGKPALDDAAVKCVTGGRFQAASENGEPIASCKDIKVTIRLAGSK